MYVISGTKFGITVVNTDNFIIILTAQLISLKLTDYIIYKKHKHTQDSNKQHLKKGC